MMRRNASFGSNLCGVNATLVNTVTIADFNATSLLQLRLREVGVNGITEICSNNFTLQVHYNGMTSIHIFQLLPPSPFLSVL